MHFISFWLLVIAFVGPALGQEPLDLKTLIRDTRNPDQQTRIDALARLASLGPRAAQAVPELCGLIEEPRFRKDSFTLFGAIVAVGEMGLAAKSCIPVLRRVQRDRGTSSASQGEAGISILKIQLHDRDPAVRVRAATDLGGAGTGVLSALRSTLGDPDVRVGEAAARSIKQIEARHANQRP